MGKKLGEFLGQRRVALGLSQAAVAKAVGVSRPHITQIETGARDPHEDLIPLLFGALGITMEEAADKLLADDPRFGQLRHAIQMYDVLNKYLTAEQIAEVTAAFGTPEQIEASIRYFVESEPLVAAPDGWSSLSKADRTLIQRLINRILDKNDA